MNKRQRLAERYAKAWHSPERCAWMKAQPCLVCGKVPSEQHHVIPRSRGGTYRDIVPLCQAHHSEGHTRGGLPFQARSGVDLDLEAIAYDGLWRGET